MSEPVVIPNKASFGQRLAASVLYVLLRFLRFTWRVHVSDPHGVLDAATERPFILCAWHNRAIYALFTAHGVICPRSGRKVAAMVSASRDGALAVEVLHAFGIVPVRGSTSRRGRQALLESCRQANAGLHLAITPDGPRGPVYEIQQGVLSLAQVTGLPIVPLGCDARCKVRFNSWDRFQLPWPLTRCDVVFGEPLLVPRKATDEQQSALREELKRRMEAINPE
ncbi:MAG: lysophospholipid acyltransferase family protein [Verrucomicrobiota bacterium]|nr:lysophospholipid acyltransferase family protein [Verrucomicrobiota bacterium]MDP7049753.1 lysophospholipid acyltransferase family protein [Verrucomicrobiota bacterium]